ncbi:ferrochelatase [Alcaligenaceae bacterium]|nr:ferrochelatase [Alcaligenaceae bacterium]
MLFTSPYAPEAVDEHALNPNPPLREAGPIGVLMVNLGTPDAPTPSAIRRYLAEFLSDPRIIEIPQWLWQIILRGFILTRRPAALAPRYKDIWLKQGSPLLVYSQAQADGVQQALLADNIHVELAMRYGNPSIAAGLDALRAAGCERILTLPLYPQYAASTTATVVDSVHAWAKRQRNQPELRFIKRYHDLPAYINVLARQVQDHWTAHGKPERLLLSFHGVPRRTIELGDPYHRDCMETAALLKQQLGADGDLLRVSFQSRFGAAKWLEPYTEPTLRSWAKQGIKQVDVMCPGFLADCLETLEEIQVECRDAFVADGGQQLRYLPCLNDDPEWISGLTDLIGKHLLGWTDQANSK